MIAFLLISVVLVILLVLVSLINLGTRITYNADGAKVFMHILFFDFVIFPKEKRVKVQRAKKNASETKNQSGGELPGAMELVKLGGEVFGQLRKKLRVDLFEADIRIASDDPFKTAMMFGGAGAGVGILVSGLENIFIIRKKDISVNADFSLSSTRISFELILSIRVFRAFSFFVFVLRRLIQMKKEAAAVDKDEINMRK